MTASSAYNAAHHGSAGEKEPTLNQRKNLVIGTAAMVTGAVLGIAGALWAHFTGLSEFDAVGREIYPAIPRGWVWELIGQVVSLTGVLVLMAGIAVAFLYQRSMTWARASIGAMLFAGLAMILFGVIPNQWLTLTQSVWEWTPQKIAITIPRPLALNNDVSISYAAIKDIVSGTYSIVALGAIAVVMYKWQEREQKAETAPPPQPVSPYGRPLRKVEG